MVTVAVVIPPTAPIAPSLQPRVAQGIVITENISMTGIEIETETVTETGISLDTATVPDMGETEETDGMAGEEGITVMTVLPPTPLTDQTLEDQRKNI